MGRRTDHTRDELREMALAAAGEIVAKKGPAALTARSVAAGIGYTPGTLYLVFRNLDDLTLQLNARTLDALHERLESAVAREDVPATRVRAAARAYLEFATSRPHRWRLVFEYHPPEGESIPDWYRQKVMRTFDLVLATLRPLAGHWTPAALAKAAQSFWASVHGVSMLALQGSFRAVRGASPAEIVDVVVDMFTAGLSGTVPKAAQTGRRNAPPARRLRRAG